MSALSKKEILFVSFIVNNPLGNRLDTEQVSEADVVTQVVTSVRTATEG